jgi:hypothetical protein
MTIPLRTLLLAVVAAALTVAGHVLAGGARGAPASSAAPTPPREILVRR